MNINLFLNSQIFPFYQLIKYKETEKSVKETKNLLESLNFKLIKCFETQKKVGLFGTGCDEYVFKKNH